MLRLSLVDGKSWIHFFENEGSYVSDDFVGRIDFAGPLQLIEGQLVFTVLQMDEPFQYMCFHVVFSVFDSFGGVELAFSGFGSDEVETR